jgi:hypothetical protein
LFIENFRKITTKFMFYGSVIKQQIKFVVFNTKICSFSTKYLHLYSHSKNVYLWLSSTSPKLPLLVSPQVTINMNKKTKFNKKSINIKHFCWTSFWIQIVHIIEPNFKINQQIQTIIVEIYSWNFNQIQSTLE